MTETQYNIKFNLYYASESGFSTGHSNVTIIKNENGIVTEEFTFGANSAGGNVGTWVNPFSKDLDGIIGKDDPIWTPHNPDIAAGGVVSAEIAISAQDYQKILDFVEPYTGSDYIGNSRTNYDVFASINPLSPDDSWSCYSFSQHLYELIDGSGNTFVDEFSNAQLDQLTDNYIETYYGDLDLGRNIASLKEYLQGVRGDFGWGREDEVQNDLSWFQNLLSQFTTAQTEASPLVLDLDGDGIELTALNGDGAVYWDIDQDGQAEASGWVSGDDGLLALDRNNDGMINNHSELFGTESEDGFVMLSSVDSNGDGVIDAADTDFADLRVWQDANGDGISQADELHTLADLNISEISLNATVVEQLVNGNTIRSESTFTMNGQTYDIADAWFAYDDANTVFAGDYNLDVRTLFLPTARGYGDMPDLHIAMSRDEGLLDMVETIATGSLETLLSPAFDFAGKMTDVLYRWAGVENVDPNGRGQYIDGRDLAFLEALTGQEFHQRNYDDPWHDAAQTLGNAFTTAYNALAARILVQSAGAELFTTTASYNPVTDEFDGSFALNLTAMETVFDDMNLSGADLTAAWNTVIRLVDTTLGLDSLSASDYTALDTMILNSDPNGNLDLQGVLDTIYEPKGVGLNGTEGDDILIGGAGNDELETGSGDDELYGRQGDDILRGGHDDDILYGEGGADKLYGEYGQDTLVGGAGDDVYKIDVGVIVRAEISSICR